LVLGVAYDSIPILYNEDNSASIQSMLGRDKHQLKKLGFSAGRARIKADRMK
jgi:hypothetical protein